MARQLPYGFRDRDTQMVVNRNAETLEEMETSVGVMEPLVTSHETQLGPTGTATILNTTLVVSVTHNYGSSNHRVSVTPLADLGSGQRFWVSNKLLNSFDINLSSAAVGNKVFEWIVRGN